MFVVARQPAFTDPCITLQNNRDCTLQPQLARRINFMDPPTSRKRTIDAMIPDAAAAGVPQGECGRVTDAVVVGKVRHTPEPSSTLSHLTRLRACSMQHASRMMPEPAREFRLGWLGLAARTPGLLCLHLERSTSTHARKVGVENVEAEFIHLPC